MQGFHVVPPLLETPAARQSIVFRRIETSETFPSSSTYSFYHRPWYPANSLSPVIHCTYPTRGPIAHLHEPTSILNKDSDLPRPPSEARPSGATDKEPLPNVHLRPDHSAMRPPATNAPLLRLLQQCPRAADAHHRARGVGAGEFGQAPLRHAGRL